LSFLKNSSEDNNNIKDIEKASNLKYKEIILESIYPGGSATCSCGEHIKGETTPEQHRVIEIECKGILNSEYAAVPYSFNDEIYPGEMVLICSDETIDIAMVKETGCFVHLRRKTSDGISGMPCLVRKLSADDILIYNSNRSDEEKAKPIFKKLVSKNSLEMKLVDIHYQFDRKKMFFFYTSDGRVDFRVLAKDLASEFKTRIELRQIGVRDEAKKIGGLGTCGREYCCSTFLCNFKKISTNLASEQNLSSNLSKLSGPCGKLKCCLSYEAETSISLIANQLTQESGETH